MSSGVDGPRDWLSVPIEYFSQLSGMAAPYATHSVGVSHLREYLDVMYGGPMPQGEAEQDLAEVYFRALGEISTDESIYNPPPGSNPYVTIAKRVKLLESLLGATDAIGEHVDSSLSGAEASDDTEDGHELHSRDLTYMLGLHDVGSFVVAGMLEIHHPRLENPEQAARAEGVTPQDQGLVPNPPEGERGIFELLAESSLVGDGMKRRMQRLLATGHVIVDRSLRHYEYVRRVVDGDQEL